jgi:hypothetical protein
MLESIAGYVYLTYRNNPTSSMALPINSEPQVSHLPLVQKATLDLQTDQVILKKGQLIKVLAYLNTFGNHTSAADLTIHYDPASLIMVASNSAKPFADSKIYQKTVFNNMDNKAGLATMSAVSESSQFFSGQDFLTSMVFKALRVGPTEITIVFTPGETRDTNIVSETKDILESVKNLPIIVQP